MAPRKSRADSSTQAGTATPDPAAMPSGQLWTPAQVAQHFRVDPKTVTRWAQQGRLTTIRTVGGHRRYYESEVMALTSERTVRRIT